ncbi:MAG: hypothetical protein ABJA87_11090 [bacterium]
MRWDELFADLEAQADALAARERAAEVDELVRAELSRLTLVDRLRGAGGTVLTVRCLGGARVDGVAGRVGPDWLLIDEPGREAIIALRAVSRVSGLGRISGTAPAANSVASRLRLGSVLRGIARDRSRVAFHLIDGDHLEGTIDRVGADAVEVAVHPGAQFRRRGEVSDVPAVPFSALAVVRRESAG